MKINLDQFNIPKMYNKEYIYTLLRDEPIEDIEEIFVKTATQFKRDLKEWFPEKPKTGSFKAYFKSLEATKEVILNIEEVSNWNYTEFEAIYNLRSVKGLDYKSAINKHPTKRQEYNAFCRDKEAEKAVYG